SGAQPQALKFATSEPQLYRLSVLSPGGSTELHCEFDDMREQPCRAKDKLRIVKK
ncbi:hypothetical protein K1T71_001359, partial [Dendrolimus kikuchii]